MDDVPGRMSYHGNFLLELNDYAKANENLWLLLSILIQKILPMDGCHILNSLTIKTDNILPINMNFLISY